MNVSTLNQSGNTEVQYSLPDPEFVGSGHNLLTEWNSGEITWEPPTNNMADSKHCGKFKAWFVTYQGTN